MAFLPAGQGWAGSSGRQPPPSPTHFGRPFKPPRAALPVRPFGSTNSEAGEVGFEPTRARVRSPAALAGRCFQPDSAILPKCGVIGTPPAVRCTFGVAGPADPTQRPGGGACPLHLCPAPIRWSAGVRAYWPIGPGSFLAPGMLVEAAGVEPASVNGSGKASTCVDHRLILRGRGGV